MDSNNIAIKKKKKKQKKKKVREETSTDNEPNNTTTASLATTENGGSPVPKKKKKKKKKKASNGTSNNNNTDGEIKKKKKKTKGKKRKRSEVNESTNGDGSGDDNDKQTSTKRRKKSATVAEASEEEIQKWRTENEVKLDGIDASKENNNSTSSLPDIAPWLSFDRVGASIPSSILAPFIKGFKTPSPIQAQCWPIACSGNDLVGIAETGSGKTLGFLMPAILKMHEEDRVVNYTANRPSVLVLAPTRELAMQSVEVVNEVSAETGIYAVCVAGGLSKGEQLQKLREGAQIVVATPGRLLSMIREGECDLSQILFFVLDEADRMLDMGFIEDIEEIASAVPTNRQTLMFSATWPEDIRKLAMKYLSHPRRVTIGSDDISACERVTQIVEVIDRFGKDKRLEALLQKYHKSRTNRILVFCLYKKEAARVEQTLRRRRWNAVGIHGDMMQQQRTAAFNSFRDGSTPILVATDVASRGLDIPNVEYVINLTFPLTIEDYIHRIGRTGRAGKTGVAHTLFTVEDKSRAGDLCEVLKSTNQHVPPELEKFGPSLHKKKAHSMYGDQYSSRKVTKKKSHIKF